MSSNSEMAKYKGINVDSSSHYCPNCGTSNAYERTVCQVCGLDMKMMTNLPQPVTIDTIKKLRLAGRYGDAKRLMEAYRENARKEKSRMKKRLRKILIEKKVARGLCRQEYCDKKQAEDSTLCEDHTERQKRYNEKYTARDNKKWAVKLASVGFQNQLKGGDKI